MKHIVILSGGKDSTGMLLKMVDEKMPIDEIIFIDTGVEFPEIYDHIRKVAQYIGREVVTLKASHSYEYYLGERVKKNGTIGYGHPDFKNRWCTFLLKKAVIRRYFLSQGNPDVTEYHGIAYDERSRANHNNEKRIRYPLIEFKMTERDALNYAYSKGFDFGGLYKKFARVSCWCCPMKRISELRTLYTYYPQLWQKLKEMDAKSFRSFRANCTFTQLDERFKLESKQLSIF